MREALLMIASLVSVTLAWVTGSPAPFDTEIPAAENEAPAVEAPAVEPPAEVPAAEPEPAPAPTPTPAANAFQIRAAQVYLGDGNRVEDGVVLVEDGRIRRVGRGVEIDPSLPVMEHDGVLTAGIVACHSFSGVRGENHDSTRTNLAEGRIAYAFHPEHSDFKKAVRSGITSMVLAPTGQNLAGGQTCVVKTAGGRMLDKEAHLALSFSQEALIQAEQSFFFFFNADATALDDGLENTGSNRNGGRYPTSYPGSIAALDAALANPEGVFAQVAAGEMPVLLEAWDRNEVVRAAGFAKQHGLRGAIRGAPLAGEVVGALAGSGLGVVVGPFDAGHPRRSLDGLPALTEAGVPLAFALGGSENDPEQVRLSAALAVGAGVDPVAAWKALSSDAARLAGVEDRVGRLERGMDADLVLWSGDPLDLTATVEAVFIDGELVHGGAQ